MRVDQLLLLYDYFLYFPEDKRAYIPAVVEMIFLFLLCFAVFSAVKKLSKRQEMKMKELEQRILREKEKKEGRKSESIISIRIAQKPIKNREDGETTRFSVRSFGC